MNIAELTPDKDTAAAGVWLPFMGAEFLIASQDTGRYDKALMKNTRKENAAEIRRDPEILTGIVIRTVAETLLLDWKGVKDGATELKPTMENKIKVLKIREFRDWVSSIATDVSNFRAEALAADAEDLKSGPEVAA